MARIEPVFFHLYAVLRRSALAPTGYPKENPIAKMMKPPELGNLYAGERQTVTQDDWDKAEVIERYVNELKRTRPADVYCLDVWENAMVDQHPDRKTRIKELGLKYNAVKTNAWRCKQAIERLMYG